MTKFFLMVILIYVSLNIVLYFKQRSLMYHPFMGRGVMPAQAEIMKVTTEDGLELEGWYFKPGEGKPVLVYFHGNAGSIGGRVMKIPDYVNAGYGVLLAEYRGFGGNPGSLTEEGAYKDAWAYLGWLEKEQHIPVSRTILYGESLGTAVAIEVAAQLTQSAKPPMAVVLEAPFSSMLDLGRRLYFFVPVDFLLLDRYMSRDKIGKVHSPVFIINGQYDEVIPTAQGQAVFKLANEPKQYVQVPNGHHNDLHLMGLSDYVLDFLAGLESSNRDNEGSGISGE